MLECILLDGELKFLGLLVEGLANKIKYGKTPGACGSRIETSIVAKVLDDKINSLL